MNKAYASEKVDYFRAPRPLWRKIRKVLPKHKKNKLGGRPRIPDRAVINGIWYVLWTGCQWKAVHRDWFDASSSVLHERFQTWRKLGVFQRIMRKLVKHYAKRRDIKQDFEAVVKLASVTELLIGEGQQTPVSIAFFTYSCA